LVGGYLFSSSVLLPVLVIVMRCGREKFDCEDEGEEDQRMIGKEAEQD
jgi:hypothetical protein